MTQRAQRAESTVASFDDLVGGIARARYVIRKVMRIVDEQAREAGIDPLHHQALLQIYGADDKLLHITELAERLDVPAALASRLVTALERRDLVRRERSASDLRMIEVHVTDSGAEMLRSISPRVAEQLQYFSRQLSQRDKVAALRIMAAYVGLELDDATLHELIPPPR